MSYFDEMVVSSRSKSAASEIQEDELGKAGKAVIAFGKKHNLKVDTLWDGIHGQIVQFLPQGGMPGFRLEAADMKKLASIKGVRWIGSTTHGHLDVGVEHA